MYWTYNETGFRGEFVLAGKKYVLGKSREQRNMDASGRIIWTQFVDRRMSGEGFTNKTAIVILRQRPNQATEPSVQLDLEFGTVCQRTSHRRTCHRESLKTFLFVQCEFSCNCTQKLILLLTFILSVCGGNPHSYTSLVTCHLDDNDDDDEQRIFILTAFINDVVNEVTAIF